MADDEDIDVCIVDYDNNPKATAPRRFKDLIAIRDRYKIGEGLTEVESRLECHREEASCLSACLKRAQRHANTCSWS